MRPYLAAVLAIAVGSLQAQALAFHTHRVPDDVAGNRHSHAPAIHHHDDDHDAGSHVDTPDASTGGIITVAVSAVTAVGYFAADAEMTEGSRSPELPLIGDARVIDVRSHGPPSSRAALLRGPPSFRHF